MYPSSYPQPPHSLPPQPPHYSLPPQPPPAKPALGIVAIVLALVALAPIGLAGFNAIQGVRLADDTALPLFLRAIIMEANGRRVLIFGLVAAFLLMAGLALGAIGRRALVAQIAMGVLGLELLGLGGIAVYSRKMPSAAELRARAGAEKAADEAKRAKDAPPPDAQPKPSNRMIAYTLGRVVGQTVLGRANGASSAVVERQIARGNTLASALDVTVSPFPELTNKRSTDSAKGLDYILDGGGKSLTRALDSSLGAGPAALLELGMKSSIVRMMYFPRTATNAAYVAVFDRTSKAANLKTPAIAVVSAKIKGNAPRSDVYDALDTMDEAIKTELKNEGTNPVAVGTTSVTAADIPSPSPAVASPARAPAARER